MTKKQSSKVILLLLSSVFVWLLLLTALIVQSYLIQRRLRNDITLLSQRLFEVKDVVGPSFFEQTKSSDSEAVLNSVKDSLIRLESQIERNVSQRVFPQFGFMYEYNPGYGYFPLNIEYPKSEAVTSPYETITGIGWPDSGDIPLRILITPDLGQYPISLTQFWNEVLLKDYARYELFDGAEVVKKEMQLAGKEAVVYENIGLKYSGKSSVYLIEHRNKIIIIEVSGAENFDSETIKENQPKATQFVLDSLTFF